MTGEEDSRRRVEVTVTGVVQAVGFRPFVYRRARAHGLGGSVRNTGDAGVEIALEGEPGAVEAFLVDLEERPPPLSVVESVSVEEATPTGEETFEIAPSTDDEGSSGTIPPDTGICDACLDDVRDSESRYHRYWATSCVDCGPRYTVIESLPYDRPRTTMSAFPLCEDCREEYEDPADRRYHAQTIACPECGPSLSVLDAGRNRQSTGRAALEETTQRLQAGELVAIRGIGGTHLACLATDVDAGKRLREETGRPGKPFALMAPDVERVEAFATVSADERELLRDVRRPIVVLETGTGAHASDNEWLDVVTPGLHTVGVMLPYAGLHHLLFEDISDPLVMTSANLPGQPMAVTVEDIYEQLGGVVDAALVHDREIAARCDDSVVRVVDGQRRFLRRSRGWVPRPLTRPADGPPVLALGAEFDAVVALAHEDEMYPSQHLGDVDGPETEGFLRETVDHLRDLFGIDPELVACDMHPEFVTTRLAEEYANAFATDVEADAKAETEADAKAETAHKQNEPIRVQHHHAHAAGLLAEHGCDRGIVVAADGTGYGPDGTIWGGEVLDATPERFERVGGLDTFHLPGGEAAVRNPARTLASLLDDSSRADAVLAERTSLSETERETLRASLDAGVNAPATTSAGRFLDAVSALLGVCTHRNYQGEPALRLEAVAAEAEPLELGSDGVFEVPYTDRDGQQVLDVQGLARTLDTLRESESVATVAATAQAALAEGLATLAIRAASERDVDAIGFTGGVAYNDALSRQINESVRTAGCEFLGHEAVPPGDAGIAYGQTVVATARVNTE